MTPLAKILILCGAVCFGTIQGLAVEPSAVRSAESKRVKITERMRDFYGLGNGGQPIMLGEGEKIGKTVVLMEFWSMKDKRRADAHQRMVQIRKEFLGDKPFLMVSFCIDGDWETWQKYCERQEKLEMLKGPPQVFYSDAQWWQCNADPEVDDIRSNPAGKVFGFKQTPAYFLAVKARGFVEVNIPADQVREAVARQLRR